MWLACCARGTTCADAHHLWLICQENSGLRPVHNTTQGSTLHCLTLHIGAHYNNEMLGCVDSDPILALLCIAFLRLITKNHEYSHITLA